ncbi:HTH-type transcriptional regulator MtrR [Ruminiclostridium hungatei]|uniref:HTH-type transcriptional regulator MtrR n=1 Tax=Ruminiclostridium hungatei TaxID=48256 RepID=A0A1V4SKY3_RUMHU|nr:TetR/AcrR family transcriptional regulator [Ruminiclostridium hungatei]OPX44552.1 HTH-type transcriptional regulator MtrR [Ruminiclostridium hungatei]
MSIQSEALDRKFIENFEKMIPDKGNRQIIMNAIEVFSRKGLAGTKIKDIAEKAGFSQGFVYNYFKSKDDIFIKIFDLALEGAGNSVKYASELEGTPYQKIYWLTEAYLSPEGISMHHWRLIMLQATTSEGIPEEAKRISKEKIKKPFEYMLPMIIEGQNLGEIVKEDPLTLSITYFSFIQGLGITRVQNGKDIPFPSVDMVLSFLRSKA